MVSDTPTLPPGVSSFPGAWGLPWAEARMADLHPERDAFMVGLKTEMK